MHPQKTASWSRREFEASVQDFLRSLGIPFKSVDPYCLALVHRSAVNEFPERFPEHNERLEFLGDAVLELVVTHRLFADFPQKPEGEMTDLRSALVRGTNLWLVADSLGFSDLLVLSRWEQLSGGKKNQVILADTFEAFLGALYLDLGYEAGRDFVMQHVYPTIEGIVKKGLHVDPKSSLQSITQSAYGSTPRYEVLSEAGLDHDKTYTIAVYARDTLVGMGTGSSKKKAEQSAAEAALDRRHEWLKK